MVSLYFCLASWELLCQEKEFSSSFLLLRLKSDDCKNGHAQNKTYFQKILQHPTEALFPYAKKQRNPSKAFSLSIHNNALIRDVITATGATIANEERNHGKIILQAICFKIFRISIIREKIFFSQITNFLWSASLNIRHFNAKKF